MRVSSPKPMSSSSKAPSKRRGLTAVNASTPPTSAVATPHQRPNCPNVPSASSAGLSSSSWKRKAKTAVCPTPSSSTVTPSGASTTRRLTQTKTGKPPSSSKIASSSSRAAIANCATSPDEPYQPLSSNRGSASSVISTKRSTTDVASARPAWAASPSRASPPHKQKACSGSSGTNCASANGTRATRVPATNCSPCGQISATTNSSVTMP